MMWILPIVKRAIHFKNKLADILFIYNIKRMGKKPEKQTEKQNKKKQSKIEDEVAVAEEPKTQKRRGKESSKA